MPWIEGRQKSGYRKLEIAVSQKFKFDVYLLEFDAGVKVPYHTDPTVEGYEHHRVNFGEGVKHILVTGPFTEYLFGYGMKFRPDLYEHYMDPLDKKHYMLSIGWLRRKKFGK